MKKIFRVLICLVCLAGMEAWSLTGLWAQQNQQGRLNEQELSFMKKAAAADIWEVQAGKIAENRANNPAVKKFGEEMINEHSEANKRLSAIAKMKGIDLPLQMDPQHEKLYEKLQKARDFDVEYMKIMVEDHKHRLIEMENDKSKITDPDLTAWLEKMIPLLRVETASAEEIVNKVHFAREHAGEK